MEKAKLFRLAALLTLTPLAILPILINLGLTHYSINC